MHRYSVQVSCSVVSDSLQPHESQHARPPCPSPSPRVHSDSSPWSESLRHPAISSSVVPFSSCPQSLPESAKDATIHWFVFVGHPILNAKWLHTPVGILIAPPPLTCLWICKVTWLSTVLWMFLSFSAKLLYPGRRVTFLGFEELSSLCKTNSFSATRELSLGAIV